MPTLKKSLQYILIAVAFPLTLFGQDREHYEKILDTAQNKIVRLTALDSILSETVKNDVSAYIHYSQEYIELAQELDDFKAAANKAIDLQHPLTSYAAEPELAIQIINGVLKEKEKVNDSFLIAKLYLKRGKAQAKLNLEIAIQDYTLALEHYSQKDSLHRADTHLFRGQAHSNRGNFVPAYNDYSQAYELYEANKAYQYMVYAQQGLTTLFSMNGFYDKAKAERKELIENMKKQDLEYFLALEYYNQALDYNKTNQRDLEYEYLIKAEGAVEMLPSNYYTLIGIHSMFVSYYCDHNQLDEAKKHLNQIEALEDDFKRDNPTELKYLAARIDYLLAIDEHDSALELANQKLELSKKLGIEDEILTSHKLLSKIHYKSGNYLESAKHSQTASAIKDSIYTKGAANALAYYQTLYETEKRERELIEKNTSISLLKKDNESFKKAMFLGGLTIILTFILIQLYRNQMILKQRKHLHELFSQELIVSQENERKRISEDLHDGIGQQLLVIKNRLMTTDDDQTKKLVDKTIEEVRSISRDLHPFLLKELGITKAIEYTIKQIDENTSIFVSSEVDNIDNIFSKEKEVNIYRIVQESLSNIIKHAKAEAAKITITKSKKYVTIAIRDSGIGFNFPETYKDPKSLGLKTLWERIRFLQGEMKVVSKKNNGTLLEFQIPINS